MHRVAPLLATAAFVAGCPHRAPDRGHASAARPASAQVGAPANAPAAPFVLHEWGLFAIVVDAELGSAGSGVLRPVRHPSQGTGLGSLGTLGGKPVVYVHLDPGTERARFSLDLAPPGSARFDEHWPPATVAGSHLGFGDVLATRGPCRERTPPPSGDSPACRTADGYCEAAEVPRYEADHDVCLEVSESKTDLLFYRASDLAVPNLPLRLTRSGGVLSVTRDGRTPVAGPALYVERSSAGVVTIRDVGDAAGPVASLAGRELTVEAARQVLLAHATSRGLTADEADAFVDAWAPAYFGHCRRPGPEAHGRAPIGFAQVDRSLLYFAPDAAVDAAIPLTTTPPAREVRRVFLVRFVDDDFPPESMAGGAARAAPGASAAAGAVVRIGRNGVTVNGPIPVPEASRTIQRNLSQVGHCYEQALLANPSTAGAVTVASLLSPSGSVTSSSIRQNTTGDMGLASCIASAARRWQYAMPSGDDPGLVGVTVRFELAPGR